MEILEKIYKIIEEEGIIVEEVKFKYYYMDGIYFKVPGLSPTIGIRKSIANNSKRLVSTLAEELGHHFTSYGDLTAECFVYSEKIQRSKQERIARKWATEFIMPYDKLIKAIEKGCRSIHDLSDYFNVTPVFVLDRFYFLRLERPNLNIEGISYSINQSIYYDKENIHYER